MLASFGDYDLTQKELYFKLDSAFSLYEDKSPDNRKLPGIYAVFSNAHCLYVGQSKNLASRLATHLKGKYDIDGVQVKIYVATDNGYSDFFERSNASQKAILDDNEKHLIALLKPTENIIADNDFKINEDCCFDCFEEYKDSVRSIPLSIEISKYRHSYLIASQSQMYGTFRYSTNSIIREEIYLDEDYREYSQKENLINHFKCRVN